MYRDQNCTSETEQASEQENILKLKSQVQAGPSWVRQKEEETVQVFNKKQN